MNVDIRDTHYQDKQNIIQALYGVADPELGINIVDLGLVYAIAIDDSHKTVLVSMTLSTPSCPMGGLISSHVKVAIEAIKPDYNTTVELVWEPRWSAEHISEKGRAMLGW